MATSPHLSNLQTLMGTLTGHFNNVGDLVSKQIKTVVYQDFEELNELIEEQVSVNGTIQELEKEFKTELIKAYDTRDIETESYSVTNLLPHCDDETEHIGEQRDALREAVETAQQKQQHLIQLLEFAQDHIAQTFRDIFNVANKHGTHYKNTGQKMSGGSNSRIINQTI